VKSIGFVYLFVTKLERIRNISIFYFDIGVHKHAQELAFMVNDILPEVAEQYTAYGFEASKKFISVAERKFIGKDNVYLINKALCNSVPPGGKMKLFYKGEDGLGSSIYRSNGNLTEYEEVKAVRFSDWLNSSEIVFEKNICIMRMNIEGAEYDVLEDLVHSGYYKCIDGFYGNWDDVTKNHKSIVKKYFDLLETYNISHVTFNGSDFRYPFRLCCIKYDILTSIMLGLRRLELNSSPRIN
jgi:FkbM family methyltransferase